MSLYNKWEEYAQYSFNTVPQSILPMKYSMVTLMATATYDMAKIVGGNDVYAQWRKIFPLLTSDIVDDPAQYSWLVFRATNGEVFTMANPWIDGTSVKPVVFRQQQFILTDTNDAEIQQVKMFMDAIGAKYSTAPIQ